MFSGGDARQQISAAFHCTPGDVQLQLVAQLGILQNRNDALDDHVHWFCFGLKPGCPGCDAPGKKWRGILFRHNQCRRCIALAFVFLNFLEQTNILIPATRELILDRVVALGQPLDAEQLKWIIMIVLHTQPGEENALALMEDFIFDENIDHIH